MNNTSFFNFNFPEHKYIVMQCELLYNVINDVEAEDTSKNEDIASRYFLHAVAGWKGDFKDHPAQKILDKYIAYLKNKGYKGGIKEGEAILFTPNKTIMRKNILQNSDAFPTSIALLSFRK